MSTTTRFARMFWAATILIGAATGTGRADDAKPEAGKARAKIYDPKADANAQVSAAASKARRENKRVLLMFGGDWCGWCHKLHALFQSDGEIRKLLLYEYELVMVDLEAPNAAVLLAECKGDLDGVGYPFLAVLDADRKVVIRQKTDPLEEGDHHDPKKVKEFLARWVAPPLDAETVLGDGLARADSQGKRVFLHFGAPWCGWCHRLEDFLARDAIAAILDRDYVDVKIDLDRMTRAKDVAKRFRPSDQGGIPWFAILDAKGRVLITSDGPDGNIGYPAEPKEIAHFLDMLRKTAKAIEPGQVDQIGEALRDAGTQFRTGRP
jgi:thiol-disulfide isomerase/thioredoxin